MCKPFIIRYLFYSLEQFVARHLSLEHHLLGAIQHAPVEFPSFHYEYLYLGCKEMR